MRSIFIAAALLAFSSVGASAEQIWLTMDQVRPYKLETPAQKIVVGNPAIADIQVEDESNVLLFGKGPGVTNIYFFDETGAALMNMLVRVRTGGADMLVVHRGVSRTTYNCTDQCEATVTVGDDPEVFNGVSGQIQSKFGQAIAAAENAGS